MRQSLRNATSRTEGITYCRLVKLHPKSRKTMKTTVSAFRGSTVLLFASVEFVISCSFFPDEEQKNPKTNGCL